MGYEFFKILRAKYLMLQLKFKSSDNILNKNIKNITIDDNK